MRRKTLVVILACVSLFLVVNIAFLVREYSREIDHHVAYKASNAHRPLTDKPKPPNPPKLPKKKPIYAYNRNERAPAYNQGMNELKEILSELADIVPGAGPYTREDYNRHIRDDIKLIENGDLPMTTEIMKLYLQMKESDSAALRSSHSQVVEKLPSAVIPNAFGGRGIVMTGGGMYFPMVLTAIQWVRQNDRNIPIEVFVRNETEYETKYCDGIFKNLNVECVIVEKIYGPELSKKVMSPYALKPLAILASKFSDIYFMDADSLPLLDINDMFDSKLYNDTGYVLSRDYWDRYVSPHYYDIVGLKLGERISGEEDSSTLLQQHKKNAIPGMSSESGQIFVNKGKHIRSLMLAMYYNIYGPDVYFPLLMMGGFGEGDKDTYAAAAWVCNETYYQNADSPKTLGWHEDDHFNGAGMVQPDPRSDYEKYVEGKQDIPFIPAQVHSNNFKMNLKYMIDNTLGLRGFYMFRKTRHFGWLSNIEKDIGDMGDVELRLFEAMRHATCEWALKNGAVPKDWEGQDMKKYCRILSAHVEYLRSNPRDDEDLEIDRELWINLDAQGKLPEPHISYKAPASHTSHVQLLPHVPYQKKE